jgi:2-keto-3-deoxy-L-rhamnonate aldolase RhmA
MAEASDLQQDAAAEAGMLARALAFKRKLRDGGVVIGGWLTIPDPTTAEILANTGFDYLLIDSEHAPWDLQSLQAMLLAFKGSPTVPIVRVPWNDHVRIKQVLDLGVEGILAPMVRTTAECQALVRACRYPPDGIRGFGPWRASSYYKALDRYVELANEAIFVMPQIEDVATVEQLDEFLAVPGIDAVCLGPNDLSGTAGLLRQHDHPVVKGAIERVQAGAKARGLAVCMGVTTPVERQAELIKAGVRILMVTSDLELLVKGAAAALAEARAAL